MRWDLIAELQLYGFEFSYAVGLTWSLVTHQPDHIQLLVTPGGVQLPLLLRKREWWGSQRVPSGPQAIRQAVIGGHRVTLEG